MVDNTSFPPATIWDAYASPGKPLCVSGTKDGHIREDGYTVELYFGEGGKLKGVRVYDLLLEETVAEIGKVK